MNTNTGMGWILESAATLPPAGRGQVQVCTTDELIDRQADEAAVRRGQLPMRGEL